MQKILVQDLASCGKNDDPTYCWAVSAVVYSDSSSILQPPRSLTHLYYHPLLSHWTVYTQALLIILSDHTY